MDMDSELNELQRKYRKRRRRFRLSALALGACVVMMANLVANARAMEKPELDCLDDSPRLSLSIAEEPPICVVQKR